MSAIDLKAAVEKLAEMEFQTLAEFDDGSAGVFWSEAGGPSPWEMHPDRDEMLQVLDGEIAVEWLPITGGPGEKTCVPAGRFIVVPRGHWHRQTLRSRTQEFYLTPGRSLHSNAADPRDAE
jgi:mannose-6-phosphate isomerase-like protein (cupin superfamily)